MKFKKNKKITFWEGFETSFDLYGLGFNRNNRPNNISESWYNVGNFFSKTFDEYRSLDKDCVDKEETMKSDRNSRRKLQSY